VCVNNSEAKLYWILTGSDLGCNLIFTVGRRFGLRMWQSMMMCWNRLMDVCLSLTRLRSSFLLCVIQTPVALDGTKKHYRIIWKYVTGCTSMKSEKWHLLHHNLYYFFVPYCLSKTSTFIMIHFRSYVISGVDLWAHISSGVEHSSKKSSAFWDKTLSSPVKVHR
jgi:hypothetical protein